MYEFNNKEWTAEDIQAVADRQGLSYDEVFDQLTKAGMTEKKAPTLITEEELNKEKQELENKIDNFSSEVNQMKTVLDGFYRQNFELNIKEPSSEVVEEYRTLQNNYNLKLKEQDAIIKMQNNYSSRVEEFNNQQKNQKVSIKQALKNELKNAYSYVGKTADFYFGEAEGLDLASDAIYRSIFGDEKVDEYIERNKGKITTLLPTQIFGPTLARKTTISATEGLLTDEERVKKIKEFEKQELERLPGINITEAAKEGDLLRASAGVLGAMINVGGSVAYNAGTFGTGFLMDYTAQNYIDDNTEKAKLKGKTLEQLILDGEDETDKAVRLASLQAGLELFSYSKIKGALKGVKAPIPKAIPKQYKDAFRFNPKARTTLNVLTTGGGEYATEVLQEGIGKYNIASAKDPDASFVNTIIDFATSAEGFEVGVQGFAGGSGLAAGSYSARALSSVRKGVDGLEVEADINRLLSITDKIEAAKDETVKAGLIAKRDKLSEALSEKIKRGNRLYNSLSSKEISELESLSDLADLQAARAVDLQKKFNKKEISESDYKLALEGFQESYNDAKAKIEEVMAKKQEEQLAPMAEELGGKVVSMTSQEISDAQSERIATLEAEIEENQRFIDDPNVNKEQKQIAENNLKGFKEQLANIQQAQTAYGFINEKEDGSFELVINKDKPKFGTAAHEFLHLVLAKTLKGDSRLQSSLGDALTEFVNDKKGGVSGEFIRRMTPYINLETGEREANFGEETITIMSESIMDGTLKYNENFFTKVGDIIRQTTQRLGWTDVKFDTGRDVYNFIKDYNASIEKGYTSEAITKVAKEGAKGKLLEGEAVADAKAQFSKARRTVLEEINNLLPENINTKEDYNKFLDDPRSFMKLYEATQDDGVISNYVKSRTTNRAEFEEAIDSVIMRLRNFDPSKQRKEGGVVGREGFGEFVFANTNFGKLDAKKALAIKAEQAKETTSLDAEESFVQVADESAAFDEDVTPTKEKAKKPKINVLRVGKIGNKEKQIVDAVKVKEGDTFKEVLVDNTGKVGQIIFDVPSVKLTDPAKNLTYAKKIVDGIPESSEAGNIQSFFSDAETVRNFIKILPKTNVSEQTADINLLGENIDVSRDVLGLGLGTSNNVLKYFYNKTTKRSKGKKSQPFIWELKDEFTNPSKEQIEQFQAALGITPRGQLNNYDRNTGQLLKGVAKMMAGQASLSAAQRQLEAKGAPKQQVADITAAQSKIAFSKDAGVIFGGIKSLLNKDKSKIFDDRLLEFVSTFVGVNESKMSDKQKEQVLLSEDVEALEIALDETYGDSFSKDEKNKIAKEIQKQVASLNLKPKSKNVVKQQKIVDQIIKSTEAAKVKVAKFTGSNITAAKAQDDLVRQEARRKSDAVYFKRLFDKNKEQAIADLIMLGGHSHTSSKIGKGRGQYYKNTKDYYDYHLGKVGITPVYNKRGALDIEATAKKNNLKAIPATSASQSTAGAVKDHLKALAGNKESLQQRRRHEKHARRVLNEYVAYNIERYQEGLQDNVDVMLMMTSLLSNMNSVLARAGALNLVQLGVDVKKGRYEHGHPRVAVLIRLVNEHVNKNGVRNIGDFFQNYDVNIIDTNFDDAITDAGYKETLADNQTFDDPSWFRMYNDKTRGDKRLKRLVTAGTKKVPKGIESFMKTNDILLPAGNKPVVSKAISNVRPVLQYSKDSRGMSTFDFDETLIIDGENFVTATKDGEIVKIPSDKWPIDGPKLAAEGYEFDFSDFVNVRGGKEGPLLQKMKNQIKKYGPSNVFVLTARMQEAAEPIHKWLKSKGINIPLENITGLGKSEGDAKAQWFIDKYAEGYNDMYFVDDALPNVKAVKHVFDQLDVKGKSVQARIQFSKGLDPRFNKMLERTKGVGAEKVFSRVVAKKRGKNVGRFQFFVPPSADDFSGLLRYFVGKGEQGDADLEFFNEALIKPFARADREMSMLRQAILGDYKKLRKEYPDVKKKLGKMMPNSDFTLDNAIRVYLWNKAGFEIPGLSKRDTENLVARVEADAVTKAFADALGLISRQEKGYSKPGENWNTETIAYDLQNIATKVSRKKFLGEWIENKNEIFSPENLNKIEAIYGTAFREALVDILYRMENGTNRSSNRSYGQGWTNWVNGSVGAIMFFNSRSAVLQTLSMVNFINFEDNNIFAAGKAFANQKQYWSDFSTLFNSDFLKNRRAGLATNVNEAELANAVAGATNKAKAAIGYLLKIGFTPTQIADSFAIASGGATYYRNRVNKYMKEGRSRRKAEEQAFLDFQEIAEETQQSARPDRISQQQASPLGRLILAFANTPMQYNRLIKKAAGDLINKRGDWRANVSRILYYGAIQNAIFASLQNAIFALAFDDDEDEEMLDKKSERILNGMLDSLLRGSGVAGAAVATVKNTILEFMEQSEKGYKADYGQVMVEAFNVSPPIGSKARKLYSAQKTYKFNRDVMGEMDTFDYNNPIWDAAGNVTSAALNLPLDRAIRKIDNMREAFNQENSAMQRTFLTLGWSAWDLKVGEEMIMNKGKSNEYVKLMPLKQKAQYEAEKKMDAREKEEKKANQQQCTKIKSDNRRCKIMVDKPKKRCHFHD